MEAAWRQVYLIGGGDCQTPSRDTQPRWRGRTLAFITQEKRRYVADELPHRVIEVNNSAILLQRRLAPLDGTKLIQQGRHQTGHWFLLFSPTAVTKF